MRTTFFRDPRSVTMLGVLLAILLSSLDQTIVSTAMPEIVRELQGLSHLSWVFTAYMLASTVTVPIYGKLSDMYGRRTFFLLGIFLFLLGSALCGFADSMTQLIIFRGLQGIGGGAIMVNAFAIIGDLFTPAERGKWQGIIGATFGLSSIAGPLLGGVITNSFSWHWIFFINIPLGLLAFFVVSRVMPRIALAKKDQRIDYMGAAALTSFLVPFLLALTWGGNQYAWNSDMITSLLGMSVIMLITFLLVELRAKDPILPLDLFHNRVFSISVILIFSVGVAMFGALLYLPLFAQGVVGVPLSQIGFIMTPLMLSMVIMSIASGQIVARTGKYKSLAIFGVGFVALGLFLFSRMGVNTTHGEMMFYMVMAGIGLGVTMPIFNVIVQSAFGHDKMGVVTASTQLFRSVGGTVGAALFGGILNNELSQRLHGLRGEPFAKTAEQISGTPLSFNVDMLQQFLSAPGQEATRASLSVLSPEALAQATVSLEHFTQLLKIAFSGALSSMYVIGAIFMTLVLVVAFALPEIPLRKTKRPAFEEVGVELKEEFGSADAKREPR